MAKQTSEFGEYRKAIDKAPNGKLEKSGTVQYMTDRGHVADSWYQRNGNCTDRLRGAYLKRRYQNGMVVWFKVA